LILPRHAIGSEHNAAGFVAMRFGRRLDYGITFLAMKAFPSFYRLLAARALRGSLISLLIFLGVFASCGPRVETPQTEPFGVLLGLETEKLWHQVETEYGRSVRTERSAGLGTNAEAVVTDDGTPVIRIRESVAPTEVRIAHELLHLAMVSEGFAYTFEPRFSSASVTPENLALFSRTAEVVHNGVLHWMFYPKLRSMGLNPSEEFGGQLADTFFVRTSAADTMTEQDLALNFFKASIETDDPAIPERLAERYLASGWQQPLATGRAMAESVTNNKPDSPQREVEVFLTCMNQLFKETAAFSVLSQTTQPRGAVQVLTVIVSVGEKR
jgi:hypothetical protein